MNEGDKPLGTAIQLALYEKRGKLIIQALSIVRRLAAQKVIIDEEHQLDDISNLIIESKKISEELQKLED
jgi:hypothetical protein